MDQRKINKLGDRTSASVIVESVYTLDTAEQEDWEQILRNEGLSMRRGEKIGPYAIRYGWNEDRTTDEPTEDDYSEEANP